MNYQPAAEREEASCITKVIPNIGVNVERIVHLDDRYLSAQFQHFRSVSYAKAVSCTSSNEDNHSSFMFREDSSESIMAKHPLTRTRSTSAPASPKGGHHHQKTTHPGTADLASTRDVCLTAATKKKKSASISNFFRRLSPRLQKNTRDSKPWVVVEFAQCDIDGPPDRQSNISDHSYELALKNRDFLSLSGMNNTNQSSSHSTADDKCVKHHKHFGWKFSSKLPQSVLRFARKSAAGKDTEVRTASGIKSKSSVDSTSDQRSTTVNALAINTNRKTIQAPQVIITADTPCRLQRVQRPPQSLDLADNDLIETSTSKIRGMESVDSIGTCSLDVDDSCLESMTSNHIKNSNTINISDNTLRSISLDDLETTKSSSVDQRKERSPSGRILKVSSLDPSSSSVRCDNNSKKPSYLNISCSISGYSNFSRYPRSRDNSPARFLNSSRDTSPSPHSKMISTQMISADTFRVNFDTNGKDEPNFVKQNVSSETKDYILNSDLKIDSKQYYSSHHEFSVVNEIKNFKSKSMTSFVRVSDDHQNSSESSTESVTNFERRLICEDESSEKKNIVKQRIERLNARRRRDGFDEDDSRQTATNGHSPSHRGSPPVFRHLRKEFRDQLNVTSSTNQQESNQNAKVSLYSHRRKSSPVRSSIVVNGTHSNRQEMEKPNVPKKPDGLVPTSAKLVMQLSSSKDEQPEMEKKDGHYFFGIVDVERRKINDIVTMLENELSSGVIPEEACGKVRSAIGKAILLTTKKFSQFKKLCEKNLNQSSDEQFSTNSSDLEGFWDMVMLQVTDIHDTFRQIDKMRKNSWKEDAPSATNGISKPRRSTTALRGQSKSAPTTPEKSAKAAAAAKARDEARKKLIEAKKKGRQNNSQKDNNVEIFMP